MATGKKKDGKNKENAKPVVGEQKSGSISFLRWIIYGYATVVVGVALLVVVGSSLPFPWTGNNSDSKGGRAREITISHEEAVPQINALFNQAMELLQENRQHQIMEEALVLLNKAGKLFNGIDAAEVQEDTTLLSTAVNIFDTAGNVNLVLAMTVYLDPFKRQALLNATHYFKEGLNLVTEYHFVPDALAHFWKRLGKSYSLLKKDCKAAVYYEQLLHYVEQDLSQLSDEQDDIQKLVVSAVGSCFPRRGVLLWNQLIDKGYVKPTDASSCTTCWAYIMVAHARVGGVSQAEEMFRTLELSQHTPYRHALQVPRNFNSLLATEFPEPYLNITDYAACRALETHKETIIQEYTAYRHHWATVATVTNGTMSATTGHEVHHADTSLSEESGGGWEALFLRRMDAVEPDTYGDGQPGWQSNLCKRHFPKTCAALANIPEISGKLKSTGSAFNCGTHKKNSAWCYGKENEYAGGITFYSLRPGASLRLHTGFTNQRLKCYLIIQAPTDGEDNDHDSEKYNKDDGWAWMEVGGIRRRQRSGDVIGFDDSYLHTEGNNGSTERVILDVTFFHPALVTDMHAKSTSSSSSSSPPAVTLGGEEL